MRPKHTVTALLIAILLAAAGVASAREILRGDQCTVGVGQVVETNVFVLCRTLIVDGVVEGNLIGAATNATINGEVHGNVYLLAGQLNMRGTLHQNLHFAGPVLRVEPPGAFTDERASLMSLSLSTDVMDGTELPGTLVNVGYQLLLGGNVGGEINFWGSALEISGQVDGDLDVNVGDSQSGGVPQLQTLLIPFPFDVDLVTPGLRVAESGVINGQLTYSARSPGIIEGELALPPVYRPVVQDFTPTIPLGESDEDGVQEIGAYLSRVFREVTSLVVIGAVGILLVPHLLEAPIHNLHNRPLSNLAVGLLIFVLSFPVVIIGVAVSAVVVLFLLFLQLDSVAIVIGIVLGVVDIGSASLFYFVAVFVARIIVSLTVGRIVVRQFFDDGGSQRMLFASLLAGVAVLSLFASLPFIGWIFNGVAVFLGLGAIMTAFRSRLSIIAGLMTNRSMNWPLSTYPRLTPHLPALSRAPLPRRPEEAQRYPPPIIDDGARTPGVQNLPEGFDWWEDGGEQ